MTVHARSVAFAIAVGIVVAIAGGLLVELERPIYVSTITMIIDQPVAIATSTDDGIIAKLARLKFKYASLIQTAPLAGPIAGDAGVPVGEVARSVSADGDPSTQFLKITVRTTDRSHAERMADSTSVELERFAIADQRSAQIASDKQFTLRGVGPALPAAKVRPTTAKALTVAGSTGLLGALVTLVAVEAVSRTGRRRTV